MASYSLIDQPWIPCILADGGAREYGLEGVLLDAQKIREVFDPSPLVTAAIHRLLLAILHRNFGPAGMSAWQRLWNPGRWDGATLSDYLGRWRHRFDLFHSQRPFYQVPRMEKAPLSPALRLALEGASGNNPTLFDHNTDTVPQPVPAAQAARWLLASQAYSIGFGKSQPFYLQDAPLTRGLTLLATGRNLFETLALNLLPYNRFRPIPWTGEDCPAWEQESPAEPEASGTPPRGYLDYLSWQSRSVHLIAEGDPPRVRWCQMQQRLKLAGEPMDPFKAYRRDEKEGLKPLGLSAEKAVWRDSHTLFQTADRTHIRPELFNWLARLDESRSAGLVTMERVHGLDCFGFASEPGKAASVTLWRHERLPLPLAYLHDEDLLASLKDGLAMAEEVGRLFQAGFDRSPTGEDRQVPRPLQRLAALLLSPADETKANKDSVRDLLAHLAPDRIYWSRLEVPFRSFLVELAADASPRDSGGAEYGRRALPRWAAALRRAAADAFRDCVAGLDSSGRTLRARAVAERDFRGRVAAILKAYLKDNNVEV